MHFVIFCIDKPGINRDPAVMQAHIDYLNKSPVKNVISGPLTGDDGEGIIGSLYIVEAENRKSINQCGDTSDAGVPSSDRARRAT